MSPPSTTSPKQIPPVYHKHHARQTVVPDMDPIELRKIGALPSEYISPIAGSTTLGDLESSRPNPQQEEEHEQQAVGLVPSLNNPSINRGRLFAACLLILTNGMNDAAPGALIPYMEKYYDIGYAVVSLIFLANAAGFIFAAFVSQPLYSRIGRSWTILVGVSLLGAAFIALSFAPPWGVVVSSYFITGAGMALILAQCNVFCSNLANSTTLFGYVHGSYGVGGTIAPLMATAMASNGIKWSHFYFILLGLTVLNGVFSTYIFAGSENDSHIPQASVNSIRIRTSKKADSASAIKNKYSLIAGLFIFAYQGAEVAIGGWTVSFLIASRNGDPAEVGYVASGFWAGITIGRFVLSSVCHRFGEKRSVYFLIAGSIMFQILVWKIPNIVSNAVFVSLVGLLIGPIYPCTMTILTRLIDSHLLISSISLVSAVGSSGGAIAPFTTGLLASRFGAWVLHPVSVGLFVVMEGIWWILPSSRKRTE